MDLLTTRAGGEEAFGSSLVRYSEDLPYGFAGTVPVRSSAVLGEEHEMQVAKMRDALME